jgi:hypothetical protein
MIMYYLKYKKKFGSRFQQVSRSDYHTTSTDDYQKKIYDSEKHRVKAVIAADDGDEAEYIRGLYQAQEEALKWSIL